MGLDITAYKNLKPVENPELDDDNYPVNYDTEWMPCSMEFSERNWPGRGEGVDPTKVYTYEASFDYCVGSYGYYSDWRSELELISDGQSFMELIHFADNEGIIGPKVSGKLYTDFVNNYEKVKTTADFKTTKYFITTYEFLMKVFDMARHDGAVEFH